MNVTRTLAAAVMIVCGAACGAAEPSPAVVCAGPDASDQDDMCIWIHPTDRSKSTVITADKAAGRIFVYDLAGKVIQSLKTPTPGNIDLRYNVPLGGKTVDIVAWNQRSSKSYVIVVCAVDPATRRIARVDNGKITTGQNYGGTLFRSPKTGKVYFVTTAKGGVCEQYELADDGEGKIKGTKVRAWRAGYSEGAVGDDLAGKLYIGEERKGVWLLGGEPTDPAPGTRVIRLGENGLKGEVEGLAIYRRAEGKAYLLVSNQSANNFKVYRLGGKHEYVGTFTVAGARDTDGLDVTHVNLGGRFAAGLFACHSARRSGAAKGLPVLLTPWSDIAASLNPPLEIHTTHDPRKSPCPNGPVGNRE